MLFLISAITITFFGGIACLILICDAAWRARKTYKVFGKAEDWAIGTILFIVGISMIATSLSAAWRF